jgi:hypothetical protein
MIFQQLELDRVAISTLSSLRILRSGEISANFPNIRSSSMEVRPYRFGKLFRDARTLQCAFTFLAVEAGRHARGGVCRYRCCLP